MRRHVLRRGTNSILSSDGISICAILNHENVVLPVRVPPGAMQVAADVLRIVLTRVEQEADIAIVQGEVTHDVKEPRRRHIDQSRSTAVCSIQ
ncbi:unnamed protein product [Heligmosomoides polygyrus]|uniref:Molybdopterin molybdenumtransferase n=1 Tax=Heligmosomoides polygyrus TaxID=6339 RepID=A0A183G908_HELPZ|nr:unnamed protein product [Heligmosomoides polygyrus]